MFAALLLVASLDAPPVHESDQWRFSATMDQAERNYQFGSAHLSWLEQHAPWEWNWIAEARYCRRCWDLLDDCRRVHPADAERCRQKLSELRRLLGHEDFYLGRMPDPAPFHRFVEIR